MLFTGNYGVQLAYLGNAVSRYPDVEQLRRSGRVRRIFERPQAGLAAIYLCYLGQVGEGVLLPLIALEHQKIDAVTPDRVRYAVAIVLSTLVDRARHSNVLLVLAANTSSLNRKSVLMRYVKE